MERKEKRRHILGYTVGFLFFVVFIPSVIFLFSTLDSFLFLSIVILYLKLFEEKRLLKDFNGDYVEYKKNVAMIIPFLKLK